MAQAAKAVSQSLFVVVMQLLCIGVCYASTAISKSVTRSHVFYCCYYHPLYASTLQKEWNRSNYVTQLTEGVCTC